MRFKFDPNQDFQLEAVKAITDIFEGQAHRQSVVVNVPTLHLSG